MVSKTAVTAVIAGICILALALKANASTFVVGDVLSFYPIYRSDRLHHHIRGGGRRVLGSQWTMAQCRAPGIQRAEIRGLRTTGCM